MAGWRWCLLFLSLVIAVSRTGNAAELYFAHAEAHTPETDPAAAIAATFKRELEARTDRQLVVNIVPEGRLGDYRDFTKLVESNVIQAAIASIDSVAVRYPAASVMRRPYTFESTEAAQAVFDGPFGQRLTGEIERRTGFVVLGLADRGGFYMLTNSRRPIRSPQDSVGLTLRAVPQSPVDNALVASLGAKPVEISPRGVYSALAGGMLDGQFDTLAVILSRRYDEVQKFATLIDHLVQPYVLIFSRQTFAALPAAQQAAVREAGVAAIATGRAVAHSAGDSLAAYSQLTRRLDVIRPTKAESEAFRVVLAPAAADYFDKHLDPEGRDLLAAFTAAASAANAAER